MFRLCHSSIPRTLYVMDKRATWPSFGLISCHRTGRPYPYRGVASGTCCPSLCPQPALCGRELLTGAKQQETFWQMTLGRIASTKTVPQPPSLCKHRQSQRNILQVHLWFSQLLRLVLVMKCCVLKFTLEIKVGWWDYPDIYHVLC